jgi:death-associated protein kinase
MEEGSVMKEDDESLMMEEMLLASKDGKLDSIQNMLHVNPDLDFINYRDSETDDTGLHIAARHGHLPIIEFLLQRKADPNARNKIGRTPSHDAAANGHANILDLLFRSGSDMNAQDMNGHTALHISCKEHHVSTAILAVRVGCQTDIIDQQCQTALHIACHEGLLPVVQVMCAFGCNTNVQDQNGLTPLHWASKNGDSEMVRYLLLSGADCDIMSKDQVRCEDMARGESHNSVADLLCHLRTNVTAEKKSAYIQQLHPTTTPINRIKIKVFGNSGVGKTTLIESLKCSYVRSFFRSYPSASSNVKITKDVESTIEETLKQRDNCLITQVPKHENYTKGVDIQQVNIWGPGDVSFWEFSGYEPYCATYDHFIGDRNCIHIIVVSLNDDMEERMRQLECWLNFIRARIAPTEPIGFAGSQMWAARVILVATHPDVAQCQKNIKGLWEMDGKAGLVNKLLKSFGADLLIAPYFHIMNAHEAASQEMKHLRNTLKEMKNFITQYLPPSLGILETAITALNQWTQVLSDYPVVTWCNFVDYIREVNPLATGDHLRELVHQLQVTGEIVYIQTNPDNDDLIVVNPKWLGTNIIGNLLSHNCLFASPSNGQLSLQYIHSLFEKCDVTNITNLLEALELGNRCQVNETTLLDMPCLNTLAPPTPLWTAEESQSPVCGGVRLGFPQGMKDQLIHIFPRLQTCLRRMLLQKLQGIPLNIYQWSKGFKIQVDDKASGIISIQNGNQSLDIECRGQSDQRQKLFKIQESLCDIVFHVLGHSCPGIYLERRPISAADLLEGQINPHIYSPRSILLAQLEKSATVRITEEKTEPLINLIAYGSPEIFTEMQPGFDQHISCLSLYARYELASLLDPSHPLGHDWCMLALSLNLGDTIPQLDIKETATFSKTDGILAIWSGKTSTTVRILHEKLVSLDRSDAVDALLSLTPLYRYKPVQDSTKDHVHQ